MNPLKLPEQQALVHERAEILQQLEDWLDLPMLVPRYGGRQCC